MKRKIAFATIAASIALASPALAAPTLWISDGRGNLATVDVASGASTVIGNSGTTLTDIAFDSTGTLYGISFETLYRVNTTTAALTTVGSLGRGGMNALVFGPDGTLFGAGGTNLYSISTLSGLATSLGSTGFASSGDLAFVGNQLYLAGDTSPGDTLAAISFGPVSGSAVGSFGVDNVFGMARGDNGVLYGVAGNSIYGINTATGATTFATSYDYANRGAAYGTSFYNEASPAVPEPATWAMMILGFGAIGGTLRRRKVSRSLSYA